MLRVNGEVIGGPILPEYWKGIHKLQEEMGELQQCLGKLCVYPKNNHPDKEDWRKKLIEELADVQAALTYLVNENLTAEDTDKIAARANIKYSKFTKWGLTGVKTNG